MPFVLMAAGAYVLYTLLSAPVVTSVVAPMVSTNDTPVFHQTPPVISDVHAPTGGPTFTSPGIYHTVEPLTPMPYNLPRVQLN